MFLRTDSICLLHLACCIKPPRGPEEYYAFNSNVRLARGNGRGNYFQSLWLGRGLERVFSLLHLRLERRLLLCNRFDALLRVLYIVVLGLCSASGPHRGRSLGDVRRAHGLTAEDRAQNRRAKRENCLQHVLV